jgi:hypothetical protein
VGFPQTTLQGRLTGITSPATVAILGPDPFARDAAGQTKTRIGTVFPAQRTLVTVPGIHATQRFDFIEWCNEQRRAAGQPAFAPAEEEQLLLEAVDVIFDADQVLIRPDPSAMGLAFAADELLAELEVISRRNIRFLFVMDPLVRDAIQARGENWRISPLPQSATEMSRLIESSRVAIREGAIYYYNRFTGTRQLTCQEFVGLGGLDDPALARQLQEIAVFSAERSRRGCPEIDFFGVERGGFGASDFEGIDFAGLAPAGLRLRFEALRRRFHDAVEPDCRQDDPQAEVWRNRMLGALISQQDQTITTDLLRALSPEFFLQVEWLPGGHAEEGEFILDPIFEEAERQPHDEGLRRLCEPLVHGFIFSYIREYGNVDYINIGRIGRSLSKVRPQVKGRRGVYLVQLKLHGVPVPLLRLIRMQKWGIRERLNEGKSLLQALLENEEYTDYVLDRRLGLRQLGMNLPGRIRILRTTETYCGMNREISGRTIPVICFERDYLAGLATDKVPPSHYLKAGYAGRLAALLGRAAATNLIVGRAMEQARQAMFDDGDEVIQEDPLTGLPVELLVSDPTGSFSDYQRSLLEMAPDYARPVNLRDSKVSDLREFAEAYLQSFRARFVHLQGEYRKRRRAFDHLFKHCRHDRAGSFAYRWECVLRRLDETDVEALMRTIREHIDVLQPPEGIEPPSIRSPS